MLFEFIVFDKLEATVVVVAPDGDLGLMADERVVFFEPEVAGTDELGQDFSSSDLASGVVQVIPIIGPIHAEDERTTATEGRKVGGLLILLVVDDAGVLVGDILQSFRTVAVAGTGCPRAGQKCGRVAVGGDLPGHVVGADGLRVP